MARPEVPHSMHPAERYSEQLSNFVFEKMNEMGYRNSFIHGMVMMQQTYAFFAHLADPKTLELYKGRLSHVQPVGRIAQWDRQADPYGLVLLEHERDELMRAHEASDEKHKTEMQQGMQTAINYYRGLIAIEPPKK
jgi:hypothetical protein